MRKTIPAAILTELLNFRQTQVNRPLRIVEVGAVQQESVEAILFDGYSTVYIARFVKESSRNHSFYSIDRNHAISRSVCERYKLADHVHFLTGESKDLLPTLTNLDLVYLDGDPQTVLDDLKAVTPNLADQGVIVVDDWGLCAPYLAEYVNPLYYVHYASRMAILSPLAQSGADSQPPSSESSVLSASSVSEPQHQTD